MAIIEDVDEAGWRKLIQINDWEVRGYFWRAVRSDAGTWGISEQDPAQRVLPDQSVRVLWPDGSQSVEVLRAEYRTAIVTDMGRSYTVDTYTLYVDQVVRGQPCRVGVEGLRFKAI